jgi:hypothetical protein
METTPQSVTESLLLMGVDQNDSGSEYESDSGESDDAEISSNPDASVTIEESPPHVVGTFARNSLMNFMASNVEDMTNRCVAYGRVVALQLRQPTPDATCPISMDSISASTVSGFEGFLLDEERPTFTEAVLPCGHSFSACYLVVSWLTSPMRCPLCRGGIDSVLEIDSIPCRWKEVSEAHVERLRLQDLEQQMQEIQAAQTEEMEQNIYSLHIHMCVYMTMQDDTIQAVVVSFVNSNPTQEFHPDGLLSLNVPRAQIRALSRSIVHQNAVSVNLVVFARRVGNGSSVQLGEITQSGPIRIPAQPSCRSSMVLPITMLPANSGIPVRDVVIVQRASIREPGGGMGDTTDIPVLHNATFNMNWQIFPSRIMNTLLGISFSVKFSDLAMFIGGMMSEN